MKRTIQYVVVIYVGMMIFSGCATQRAQQVGPSPIFQASEEIPEEALMDVGIVVFKNSELTEKEAKKEGTNHEIRKAECNFIPYHLKNTLQLSSHWGAVRVIPAENNGMDLLVTGEIIESNGEHLVLRIEAVDGAGNKWLDKVYEEKARDNIYSDNVPGQHDAFQSLYNTIANDLADAKKLLNTEEIHRIRTISKMKFAEDFAPDAFEGYLSRNENGEVTITQLPADEDPLMNRLLRIKERDHMYVDTLNEYYEGFYNEMWPAYENWRQANLQEQTALRDIRRSSYYRIVGGALLMALAIGLDASGSNNIDSLLNTMVLAGGAIIIDGVDVSRQAKIHSMAIQELSESFGEEMKPVVMEYQGKEYELTGSAQEQYAHWRELLRKIYYTETGFEPGTTKGNIEKGDD